MLSMWTSAAKHMRKSALSTPTCFMPLACHVCKAGVIINTVVKSVIFKNVVAEMRTNLPSSFSVTAAFPSAKE